MPPTCSAGVRIIAVMTGSSIFAMRPASGSFAGLSISCTSPSVVVTRYSTPGAVVTRSMSNSRSSRSWTISMCSRPRKPQRKPKPSADRRLRLVEERRVVQPQLLERVAQLGVLVALDRIQPGEHHRLQLLEAGKRLGVGRAGLGDRVADLRVADRLDVRDEEADLADAELVDRHRPWA